MGLPGPSLGAQRLLPVRRLRAKKSAWVSRSLREGRGHTADQLGVWEALAQKAEAHDVQSPTGAMHDFYARYEPEIAKARAALAPVPGQVGAVAYVADRWAGLSAVKERAEEYCGGPGVPSGDRGRA